MYARWLVFGRSAPAVNYNPVQLFSCEQVIRDRENGQRFFGWEGVNFCFCQYFLASRLKNYGSCEI